MRFLAPLTAAILLLGVPAASAAEMSGTLTRAGAVSLLMESDPIGHDRAEWFRGHMPPVSLFEDIQQHHWYAPYVEAAFERGIVRGNTSGEFQPGGILTSEQAAILFSRIWLQRSQLLLLPWSKGEYYTPTLQDVATAYGMRTPIGPRPMPRAEFISLLRQLYPETYLAQLPDSVVEWAGTPRAQQLAQNPEPPADAPMIRAAEPPMTPVVAPVRPQTPPARPDATPTIRPTTPVPTVAATAAQTDAFTISLPSLGIDTLEVHHPNNPFTHQGLLEPLKSGVGHLFSYPGRGGKILIYGHSSSYAWDISPYTKIFRRINELAVGDRVTVTFDGLQHTYAVREKKTVPAADMSSYQNEGDGEELILYTCWPPDSISQRYLVIAEPVDSVASR